MKPSVIAIDCETTGLIPHKDKLLGLSVAWEQDGEMRSQYYPHGGTDVVTPWPTEWLEDSTIIKVGHNLRFDLKFLARNRRIKNVTTNKFEDTLLIAQLLNENQKLGLKWLSKKHFGSECLTAQQELEAHLKELKLKMGDLGHPSVDQNIVARYCNEDTENTLRLYNLLRPQLSGGILDYYMREMLPMEVVLLDMELRGNRVDLEHLNTAKEKISVLRKQEMDSLRELVTEEIKQVEEELYRRAAEKFPKRFAKGNLPRPTFNWNSGPQKIILFYDILGLGKYVTTTTAAGKPSLNKKALQDAKIPDGKLKQVIDSHLSYQIYQKMYSTYVEGFESRISGNRIYGEYYQANQETRRFFESSNAGGTVTGRLSHRNPNLGNLPRGSRSEADYYKGTFVKDLFIPEEGQAFVYADYDQIELRIAAHLSQDRAFIKTFRQGGDPHQQTADIVGITRQQAKTVNFLLIYGGTAWRLAYELGYDPTIDRELRLAERIRENFFAGHPELFQWIRKVKRDAEATQHVTSMFGRVRRLPEIISKEWDKKKHAIKQAGNFVVQSAAASVCKRAMLKLANNGFTIANQVHDSITCMVPEMEAEKELLRMTELMKQVGEDEGVAIPLTAEGKILKTFKE